MEDSPPVEAPKTETPSSLLPSPTVPAVGEQTSPRLDHLERNKENVHELLAQTKRMEKVLN